MIRYMSWFCCTKNLLIPGKMAINDRISTLSRSTTKPYCCSKLRIASISPLAPPEDVASFLGQIGRNNADHIRHICVDFPTFLLDTHSIVVLANIQRGCANLGTLTMSLHSTSSMERRLDATDKPQIVSEALHLSLVSPLVPSFFLCYFPH